MMVQDHGRLYGALYALRILARKYEFKDEEDRAPLTGIVNSTFPALLQLFQVPATTESSLPCSLQNAQQSALSYRSPLPACRMMLTLFAAQGQVTAIPLPLPGSPLLAMCLGEIIL